MPESSYELINRIENGSFCQVYKAKRKDSDELVLYKVLQKDASLLDDLTFVRKECIIRRQLGSHPHIICLLDSFEHRNKVVVVLEYAPHNLDYILSKTGKITEEWALSVTRNLLSALNFLHSRRMLHRNLTPKNILVRDNIAKISNFSRAEYLNQSNTLTSTTGTLLYAAPEVIKGKPYGFKADLWSLGCVIYKCVTNSDPFASQDATDLLREIRNSKIATISNVSKECNAFVKALITKNTTYRLSWPMILHHPFLSMNYQFQAEASTSGSEEDSRNLNSPEKMDFGTPESVEQEQEQEENDWKILRSYLINYYPYSKDAYNEVNYSLGSNGYEPSKRMPLLLNTLMQVRRGNIESLLDVNLLYMFSETLKMPDYFLVDAALELLWLPISSEFSNKEATLRVKIAYSEFEIVKDLISSLKNLVINSVRTDTPLTGSDWIRVINILEFIRNLMYCNDEFVRQFLYWSQFHHMKLIYQACFRLKENRDSVTGSVLDILLKLAHGRKNAEFYVGGILLGLDAKNKPYVDFHSQLSYAGEEVILRILFIMKKLVGCEFFKESLLSVMNDDAQQVLGQLRVHPHDKLSELAFEVCAELDIEF